MDRPSRLSATFVRQIKHPGRYGGGRGGHGLSLLVKPAADGRTSKSWSQRLYINRRPVMIGLGAYPIVSLADARAKAFENRQTLAQGRDPRGNRAVTFEHAAEKTIALHADGWRNPRTTNHWHRTFGRFVYPTIANKPVGEVTTADVLAIVGPIWLKRHEQARKTLGRIRAVLRWAMAEGLTDRDATEAARAALPKPNGVVQHHKALPASEVGDAIRRVRASGAWWSTKAIYELLALTGTHSGEARQATWDEINTDTAVWEIPAERTKTARPMRVPLSTAALRVIAEARDHANANPDADALIFPSPTGRAASDATLSKLCRELDIRGTPHGLRATLRSWMAEDGVPRETAEQVLGHAVAGVEAAYMRSDLLERRREVLQRWADYITN
ncbi:MAG: tyrosine-type recombinase/integrase [bacterium]|nr:tyrosine-type recombinase/integrase [bacterium]